jgi:hypothetical protein
MSSSLTVAPPANRLEQVKQELHAIEAEIHASQKAHAAERERTIARFAAEQSRLDRRYQALLHEHSVLKVGRSTRDGL